MKFKKLFLALSIFFGSPAFAATFYYMSPSGNDLNPGTLSKPWRTLTKLMVMQKILKPGDKVFFRGGTYVTNDSTKFDDTYDYRFTAVGTATARITYQNYDTEKPIILYDRRKIINRIMMSPARFTTFQGLVFRQSEASRCISMNCNTNEYTVKEKSVRLTTIHADDVTFRNCEIDNFSSMAIVTEAGSERTILENNIIKNMGNHGLYIRGEYGKYRYNTIDGIRQGPIHGKYGIQIQYVSSHHNEFYGNLIKNTTAAGVIFSGPVSYNLVYNNVFINVGSKRSSGSMLSGGGEGGIPGPGNKFYNNTAIGKTIARVFGDNLTSLLEVEIRDNIFYPTSRIPIGLTKSYAKIKNNIFYNISGYLPTNNKNNVNPLLINPFGTTAVSAMVKSGSPAINTGRSSPFPIIDYNKRRRPAGGAYDIGAFEY